MRDSSEQKASTQDPKFMTITKFAWEEKAQQVKTLDAKVEEMKKTLDKAILEIRIWSNCYGDETSKQVAQKVVEELRQALKGDPK